MSENVYVGVKGIVEVSSDVSRSCELCDFFVKHDEFSDAVNHYIADHGFRLLHVGNRTVRDYNDHPCDTLIAVLGSDEPLAKRNASINIVIDGGNF